PQYGEPLLQGNRGGGRLLHRHGHVPALLRTEEAPAATGRIWNGEAMNDDGNGSPAGSGRRPPAGSCTEYEWMVGPLVDGELPAADAEEAERHLQSCAACTRLAADFRSFDRLAHRASQPPAVSPAEWGRIWD